MMSNLKRPKPDDTIIVHGVSSEEDNLDSPTSKVSALQPQYWSRTTSSSLATSSSDNSHHSENPPFNNTIYGSQLPYAYHPNVTGVNATSLNLFPYSFHPYPNGDNGHNRNGVVPNDMVSDGGYKMVGNRETFLNTYANDSDSEVEQLPTKNSNPNPSVQNQNLQIPEHNFPQSQDAFHGHSFPIGNHPMLNAMLIENNLKHGYWVSNNLYEPSYLSPFTDRHYNYTQKTGPSPQTTDTPSPPSPHKENEKMTRNVYIQENSAMISNASKSRRKGNKVSYYPCDGRMVDICRSSSNIVRIPTTREWLEIFEDRQFLTDYEYNILNELVNGPNLLSQLESFRRFARTSQKKYDGLYKQTVGWEYLCEQRKLGRTQMIATVFWTTIVVCLCNLPEFSRMMIDIETFKKVYVHPQDPHFAKISDLELQRLVQFRNVMVIAFEVIPPHRNEVMLLKIGACLERSGNKYQISKSAQVISTTRRRKIYTTEKEMYLENLSHIIVPALTTDVPAFMNTSYTSD